MSRGALAAIAACLLGAGLVLPGCATKIYQGPTSGRGAEQQQAVAMSVERALAEYDAAPFKGKKAVIEVYGLTERLEGESPEEGYVRALLTERLLEAGAVVVGKRKDAQLLLSASLDTVGVDVIRRDAPLIYHHTTFRGMASLRLSTLEIQGDSVVHAIDRTKVAAESIYRETYIFYVFGPITTRATKLINLAPGGS